MPTCMQVATVFSLYAGVKQVPVQNLIPDKTYVIFSHTIKAQPDNMPLLDALLEKVRKRTAKYLIFGDFCPKRVSILYELSVAFVAIVYSVHSYRLYSPYKPTNQIQWYFNYRAFLYVSEYSSCRL